MTRKCNAQHQSRHKKHNCQTWPQTWNQKEIRIHYNEQPKDPQHALSHKWTGERAGYKQSSPISCTEESRIIALVITENTSTTYQPKLSLTKPTAEDEKWTERAGHDWRTLPFRALMNNLTTSWGVHTSTARTRPCILLFSWKFRVRRRDERGHAVKVPIDTHKILHIIFVSPKPLNCTWWDQLRTCHTPNLRAIRRQGNSLLVEQHTIWPQELRFREKPIQCIYLIINIDTKVQSRDLTIRFSSETDSPNQQLPESRHC